MRDLRENFDMQKNSVDNTIQLEEIKTIFISFVNKVFRRTPYYATNTRNKKNDDFNKINDLAGKIVAQHMLKEMVKNNNRNPQNGYRIKPDDYSTQYFAAQPLDETSYQNIYDKIFSFIKNVSYSIKMLIKVYADIFLLMYKSTKDLK